MAESLVEDHCMLEGESVFYLFTESEYKNIEYMNLYGTFNILRFQYEQVITRAHIDKSFQSLVVKLLSGISYLHVSTNTCTCS